MCLQILACLCPPLAVCIKKGCCSSSCFAALLLTLLGWIPGCLYACCVITDDNKTVVVRDGPVIITQNQVAPVSPQHVVVNVSEHSYAPVPNSHNQYSQYPVVQQPGHQQQLPYNPYTVNPTTTPPNAQMHGSPPIYKP